jgi:hypothetical protein
MSAWVDLVKMALLGTEKMPLQLEKLPAPVSACLVAYQDKNAEDQFYRAAILCWAYEKAGKLPVQAQAPALEPAPEENATLFSLPASAILRKILSEKQPRPELLLYFLETMQAKKWVVPPEWLPELLQAGLQSSLKTLQKPIAAVAGARGKWLAGINPDWAYVLQANTPINWEEAGNAARRQQVETLRKQDPVAAFERIRASWEEETNSREKKEWLKIMFIQPQAAEIPFVEQVYHSITPAQQASKVVLSEMKTMAAAWLMGQPEAPLSLGIIAQLDRYIKKHKGFLGLNEAMTLSIPNTEDAFWNTNWMAGALGFEKTSAINGISEPMFWLCELARSLHPMVWETLFSSHNWTYILNSLSETAIQSKKKAPLLAYLSQSIARNRYLPAIESWLKGEHPIDASNYFMLHALPTETLEKYTLKMTQKGIPDFWYEILKRKNWTWSRNLSKHIFDVLTYSKSDGYHYQDLIKLQEFAFHFDPAIVSIMYDFVQTSDQDWHRQMLRSQLVSPWIRMIEMRKEIDRL